MKSQEAIKHMDEIITTSVREFGEVMATVAHVANNSIKTRIVETGKNAEGTTFPPYSTKSMLMNCSNKYITQAVCNQLTGSKEKRKDLKWVTLKRGDKGSKLFELEGGYKELRNLHGLRTDFVDFTWSGRMMTDIQVISDAGEHQTGRARIGTMKDEENTKLAGLTEKKGEILMLSEKEIEQVSDIIETWLADKWNE